jgi:hypothetical protein
MRSRVAFATGTAGLVGSVLVLTGRFDASVLLAILFATAARVGVAGALIDGGPIVATAAVRSLRLQASLAPAWALIIVAGVMRAGAGSLAAARGANAVAGLALARGPLLSVVAAWLAAAAGIVAIAARERTGAETASSAGSVGRVVAPVALRRLEASAVLAQAALLVTLFAGPQVTSVLDAGWWVLGIAFVLAFAWRARSAEPRGAIRVATVLAAAAAVCAIWGGAP